MKFNKYRLGLGAGGGYTSPRRECDGTQAGGRAKWEEPQTSDVWMFQNPDSKWSNMPSRAFCNQKNIADMIQNMTLNPWQRIGKKKAAAFKSRN